MELLLKRFPSKGNSTLGELFIDGDFFCYSCEDVIREQAGIPVESWKVTGQTAIPSTSYSGKKYKIVEQNSPRFGPETLTVLDVPGFIAIRIHSGNSSGDTEGCILVGRTIDYAAGIIGESRLALADLKKEIHQDLNLGYEVTLEIVNA